MEITPDGLNILIVLTLILIIILGYVADGLAKEPADLGENPSRPNPLRGLWKVIKWASGMWEDDHTGHR